MTAIQRAEDFLKFVNNSRSPFHAVATAKNYLKEAGFKEIHEKDRWTLNTGGRYYYTRNQSSLVAFAVGGKFKPGNGFNVLASHTDSPCFKVKPVSNQSGSGYLQLGISKYGGGLWHTWFDRDLTVAGRVVVSNNEVSKGVLVYIDRPILRIPNLAIHLDRTVNEGFKFNQENHLRPILETSIKAQFETKAESNHNSSLLNLIATTLGVKVEEISTFELSVVDHQPAVIGGINNEFIFSARLDNLLHAYTGLISLTEASTDKSLCNEENVRTLVLFDHEEVGSLSGYGAMSPMLNELIERVNVAFSGSANLPADIVLISKRKSFLISADMAHAIHPNYPEKHDTGHKPMMHRGPVVKINLETRYATNSETQFVIEHIAQLHNIPIQKFCVRNDMACGSTIGPILSGNTGIRTVDIGNPQLSMHSIREMCGVDDVAHCINLCKAFLENFTEVDKKLIID